MIKVNVLVDKNIKEISVIGHANYDEYGKDIVCAAVSSLVISTINNILSLEDNSIETNQNNDTLTINILQKTAINTILLNNMVDYLAQMEKKYCKNIKIIM